MPERRLNFMALKSMAYTHPSDEVLVYALSARLPLGALSP